jgi:hypothetical protein
LFPHSRGTCTGCEKQEAAQKRRLLNFVVSNSLWKGGEIVPIWRQPFDMIAVANQPGGGQNGGDGSKNSSNENRLPFVDSNHELDKILMAHKLLILKSHRSRQKPQNHGAGTKSVQKF